MNRQVYVDLRNVVNGRYEAALLDRLGTDCYAATSSRFHAPRSAIGFYEPSYDQFRFQKRKTHSPWPGNAPFAVCLTHDVDNVSRDASHIHLRRLGRQLGRGGFRGGQRGRRAVRATAVAMARSLLHWRRPDPLHCYEKWLQVEASFGAKSTFLFLPDTYHRPHYSDGGYRYHDRITFDGQMCSVEEMMRELHAQDWEVGLHASWNSYRCADEMKRQKLQVEQAIHGEVVSVRHHNLHFDIRCTPRVHEAAGLAVDSSLGFNDDIGFRTGTSLPRWLQDWTDDRPTSVLELPLVMQDKCLLMSVGHGDPARALQWAELLTESVASVGGVLTVLWHPGLVDHPLYMRLYEQLLGLFKRQGAWFGTMSQVAQRWKAQGSESRWSQVG